MNTTERPTPAEYVLTATATPGKAEVTVDEDNCTTVLAPIQASATKRMLIAGGLGLVAAGLIVASPELGVGAMIGGAVAGSGSALATLFARR